MIDKHKRLLAVLLAGCVCLYGLYRGLRAILHKVDEISQGQREVLATFTSPDGHSKAIVTRYMDAFGISAPDMYGIVFSKDGVDLKCNVGWNLGSGPDLSRLEVTWSMNGGLAAVWDRALLLGICDFTLGRSPAPQAQIEYVDSIVLPPSLEKKLQTPLRAMIQDADLAARHLCHAVFLKRMDLVKRIVAEGININQPCHGDGGSALYTSLDFGPASITKELLEMGASPNDPIPNAPIYHESPLFPQRVKGPATPLQYVVSRSGNLEKIDVLIQAGGDVHVVDQRGHTLIQIAQQLEHEAQSESAKIHWRKLQKYLEERL